MTRRQLGWMTAAVAAGGEAALAKRYLAGSKFPSHLALLNANENPDGPPASSIEAMKQVLHLAGRYRDEDMDALAAQIAQREGLRPEQVMMGSGSSEILNTAVVAYTHARQPVITCVPVFELPVEIATAMGHPVVTVPLTKEFAFDVERLAAEAKKAGGGFVYLCNPNNPTGSTTPAQAIDWLVDNLPENALLVVDEAYIHFDEQIESAMKHVRAGRRVLVARTFSKIFGMAGLRVGFGAASNEILAKMLPFRDNSTSVVGVHAASAALEDTAILGKRRDQMRAQRTALTQWLESRQLRVIPSHANFVMVDIGRDVRTVIPEMLKRGVAVGRPFPPLHQMMRVTIGTEAEMTRFRTAFAQVVS